MALKVKLEPRPYQQEAHDIFFTHAGIKNGKRKRFLISLPTGTGKALVIAMILKTLLAHPHFKILVLSHSVELVEQDFEEAVAQFEDEEEARKMFSIYCAASKKKSLDGRVIFATWQSFCRSNASHHFDLVVIDEAHKVGQKTHYNKIIHAVEAARPGAVVLGLTATPHRMGGGELINAKNPKDQLFDKIIFEKDLKYFVENGYLVPLRAVQGQNFDSSSIAIRNGEFAQDQLEQSFTAKTDALDVVESNAKKIIELTRDRPNCAVYVTTREHGLKMKQTLNVLGQTAEVVFGNTLNRKKVLTDFTEGVFKYLISVEVLTTGWNFPALSAIAMVRATLSFTVHIQIGGRGMRPAFGKTDCLFIDFGNNVARFGPFAIAKPPEKSERRKEAAPVKVCPACQTYCAINANICENTDECNYVFTRPCRYSNCKGLVPLGVQHCPVCSRFQVSRNVAENHFDGDVMGLDVVPKKDVVKDFFVMQMRLQPHLGKSGKNSLRIDWELSNKRNDEPDSFSLDTTRLLVRNWHGIEAENNFYPMKVFSQFWMRCGGNGPAPSKIVDAVARQGELAMPYKLKVKIPASSKEFKEIMEITYATTEKQQAA